MAVARGLVSERTLAKPAARPPPVGAAADLADRSWFTGDPQGMVNSEIHFKSGSRCTGPLNRGRLRHEIQTAAEDML
jgi:hypothetical protein